MTLSVEKFRWRDAVKLTLPKEHGSWSLALEPVALGLLVAPSAAGAALALAAAAGFFLRRPLKLLLAGKSDPRQPLAAISLAALLLVGLAALLLAVTFGGVTGLWPLLPAALTGAVFVWCDNRNEAREGAAEVAGAATFGMLPAAFAALAGWSLAAALALAAVMLVRSVPTVLTVRTILRVLKGQTFTIAPALLAALVGMVLTVWLATQRLAPWAAVFLAFVFAVRTCWLLLWRPRLTARKVGITEAVLGGLMIVTLAATWKSSVGG